MSFQTGIPSANVGVGSITPGIIGWFLGSLNGGNLDSGEDAGNDGGGRLLDLGRP